MAVVDDRGRIFGRVNLVDAALIALFAGLVPLAFGAYALFRTPPPKVTEVVPSTLAYGSINRVTIHGENLRPYMRVSFNERQGRTFLFESATTAEVDLGDMPPGTYDVVLYDYAQEWSRLPKALTITKPTLPSTSVVVIGMLSNLSEATAGKIIRGLRLEDYGEVLDAGRPVAAVTRIRSGTEFVDIPVPNVYQVPVSVKVPCDVQVIERQPACVADGIALIPNAFLPLRTALGRYDLQINQILGAEPIEPMEAVVRFVGNPSTLALVRAGDVDVGISMNELAAGARVLQIAASHPSGASGDLATEDVRLLLRAQKTADGWRYYGDALRAGGAFVFRTKAYELRGSVVRLTSPVTKAEQTGP